MSSKKQRNTLNPPSIKLVLLGQQGVGKSALMVRFLTRRFIGEYDPNLETTHRRNIAIGNSMLVLDIKDTTGEISSIRREKDFAWADVFVMVYSVTSEKSFQQIKAIHKLTELHRTTPTIFVLIANKIDLPHLREVSYERGKILADAYACPFYEISVSEGYHETNKVFNDIVRYVLYRKATEEGTAMKKRTNSFTYLSKGLEKQYKIARENNNEKQKDMIELREAYSSS